MFTSKSKDKLFVDVAFLELLRIIMAFGFCQSNSDGALTSVLTALTSSSHGKEKGDLVW